MLQTTERLTRSRSSGRTTLWTYALTPTSYEQKKLFYTAGQTHNNFHFTFIHRPEKKD